MIAEAGGVEVTVVIPTRNRADLLPRALKSLKGQTLERFEVIVVDDGSTDDTEAVVATVGDPRFHYVRQGPAGAAVARNRGAQAASGSHLVFLDSDDEARPRWLEVLCRNAGVENVGLVFCGIEMRDPGEGPSETVLPIPLGPLFNDWRALFLAGTFLVRRELFQTVGGYREELRAHQHSELGIRLVDQCTREGTASMPVDEALVVSHRHAGPRIRNDPRAVLEATEYMLQHYRERLQRYPGDYLDYLAVAGTLAARLGDRRRARRHLLTALRFEPRAIKNYLRLARTFLPRATRPRTPRSA